MKKFTHPQKNITLIKFQNGASYIKSWVYYRTFINDSSSIAHSYIIKLKQFQLKNKEKEIIKADIKHTLFLNELTKIQSFFNK